MAVFLRVLMVLSIIAVIVFLIGTGLILIPIFIFFVALIYNSIWGEPPKGDPY